MSGTTSNTTYVCPLGHCRAQRCAMDSRCQAAYEAEKAAIKSYEENWDDWDGPIYPYSHRGVRPELQKSPLCSEQFETQYEGCCGLPQGVQPVLGNHVLSNQIQRPHTPPREKMERPASSESVNSGTSSGSSSLWQSRSTSPCPTCGRCGGNSKL